MIIRIQFFISVGLVFEIRFILLKCRFIVVYLFFANRVILILLNELKLFNYIIIDLLNDFIVVLLCLNIHN